MSSDTFVVPVVLSSENIWLDTNYDDIQKYMRWGFKIVDSHEVLPTETKMSLEGLTNMIHDFRGAEVIINTRKKTSNATPGKTTAENNELVWSVEVMVDKRPDDYYGL